MFILTSIQVAKVEAERDEAAKKAEAIEAAEAAAAESTRELEAVRATLLRTEEDVEGRDSELEAKGGWGHQSDWMEMILWSRILLVCTWHFFYGLPNHSFYVLRNSNFTSRIKIN